MSQIDPLLIPATFIGRYRNASPRIKALCRRAVKAGSWSKALSRTEMTPAEQTPGVFIFQRTSPFVSEDNVIFDHLRFHLLECTVDRDPDHSYARHRDLIYDGLKHFWFCLAALGTGIGVAMIDQMRPDAPEVARETIAACLHWWPTFCRLSPRMTAHGDEPLEWPHWATTLMGNGLLVGVPTDRVMAARSLTPRAAFEEMQRWIQEYDLRLNKRCDIGLD